VQVAAGSVIITAIIAVPVGSTASGITNALTTTLGSTSAATSFLGIDVESSPTFTTTDNNRDRDTGNSLALPLGLGLGLGLGGCLVLSALFVLIKRRKGMAPKLGPATSGGISHVSTSSAADKPQFTPVQNKI
jgi:hypothetical protein